MSSIIVAGDTSGSITLSAPAVSGSSVLTLPVATDTLVGKATTDTLTNKTLVTPALGTPASGILTSCTGLNYDGFKNRIINGGMVIDQRNAGASVTAITGFLFITDRWANVGSVTSKFTSQQNAGAVTPPAGYINYLGNTSSAVTSLGANDYYVINQKIEGLNIADLAWGAASAATVTLSFWVRSSLTGTFGGGLRNSAQNRAYPFSYTISVANTWEQKTITIAGDTTGTWLTTNGIGIDISFSLGTGTTYSNTAGAWAAGNYFSVTGATSVVGTNGATFYITGVQLEKGATATSFDYRPYGTEFSLCQRYYQKVGSTFFGAVEGTTTFNLQVPYFITMRTSATVTGVTGGIFSCRYAGDTNITNPTLANITAGDQNVWLQVTSTSLVAGTPIYGRSQNIGSSNFLQASAEL